ncbi:PREDICTED: histone-lysine N-methyltransferase NSD2 [Fragaria vesca subsp. vesca]|uniref:histone-lysine N-methyltransferase NSD2 n=1 Tax=Fragaria vesca subsp. vesca TaxID=101020 RepID=UPI0002C348B2|nr:PREDICTED: histone-lysine N-methyltransferase NSD2 [Fragaria vesca subsp. vesca]
MPKKRTALKIPVAVEPEICPEAVRGWTDGLAKYKKKSKMAREAARKHLSAMGWKFWRARQKGGNPGDLRYESPAGKNYYLLKTACQACVDPDLTGVESTGSNSSSDPNSPMEEKQETMPRKRGRPKKSGIKMKVGVVLPKKRGRKRKIDVVTPEEVYQSTEIGPEPGTPEEEPQIIDSLASDPDYIMEEEDCKESMCYTDSSPQKTKKRGRKRKIDLVAQKPGKVLAQLKRLRLDEEHPKLQIRSPRTILSSLIDNNFVMLHAKVYYRGRRSGDSPLATGQVTREGILCDCCAKVYALTAFEAHAGSTNHRPGANIILEEDGRSISDCQQQLKSFKDEKKVIKSSSKFDKIDDLCSLCHNEGELILCDRCPSAFHTSCLGLSEVTDGEWFCPACSCGICGSGKLEEGSIPGEIRKCDQCEHKFHVGCLRNNEVVCEQNWFCSSKCQNIMFGLEGLLGQPILVGDNNLTWTLLKSSSTNRIDSRETQKKLRGALNVLHKCFEPSVDPYTQRDLVEDIVLNRESNLRRLNFQGFYTVLLERNREVICVATVRIYGEVAEVPLVATMFRYRRLGMCRILMNELEKQLAKLGVERLVLPSSPAALDTWTNTSIGFSEMPEAEKPQFVNYFFLYFTGTIMCHKFLKQRSAATQSTIPVENMELDDSSGGISVITQAEG